MHHDVLDTVRIQKKKREKETANADKINEGNNYIANHDLRDNEVDAMA